MTSFKLDIKLLPSPRPRLGKGRTYMPQNYVDQKKLIGYKIRAFKMLPNKPIKCEILIGFKVPKGGIKRNKYPVPKGDVDNYAKTVLDACEGIIFENDTLIEDLHVKKMYSDHDFVHVIFEEIE